MFQIQKQIILKTEIENDLIRLFECWGGEKADEIIALPESGSYRKYFRVKSKHKKALGVFNSDLKENIAFIEFSKHFLKKGLNVPEIYAEDLKNNMYLIQDLGDVTLFSYLLEKRKTNGFTSELIDFYKKVIEELPKFQILAAEDINYDVCYPRAAFDKQSMMWDLNYFKYYFLKLNKIPFDEQKLEDDFQVFSDYLLQADSNYFLYRDFQSRNIMIYNNQIYFIDYQGGRRGALQYDLASLLYDAKADIPQNVKLILLEHYINAVNKLIPVDRENFIEFFYGFVYIRIMQAMGAFGFRGLYEKKKHFLESIPYAIQNLDWLLNNITLKPNIPTIMNVIQQLVKSEKLRQICKEKLKVTINSFSYKKGIPIDKTGNGGGFVFDCRALPNPGKYDKFKKITGLNKPVIDFLQKEKEVDFFLNNVYRIVDQSVEKYIQNNFNNLMVSFGCTGGLHRSVYCAQKLAVHLKDKYDLQIEVNHLENEMKYPQKSQ